MRLIHVFIGCAAASLSAGALAQVKDVHGNDLRVGQPDKPVTDHNGGTISRGRAAKCVLDDKPPQVCSFFPRNGNGGFAIDVNGMAYYADKFSPTQIDVEYDNGARMVGQGVFTRSQRNPACWLQAPRRKICIY